MHTLKVTLKQHTPLIHFQHDQEGATLRASEVKPKLDKFILTKLGGEEGYQKGFEIAQNNGWIINNGKNGCKALSYKMRIKSTGRDDSVNLSVVNESGKFFARISENSRDEFPFLICNMGGKENEDDLMNLAFYDNNELEVLTFSDSLSAQLKTFIPVLFATSNFGQRKTKGFGSFSVISMTDNDNPVELSSFNSMIPDRTPIIRFEVSGNRFEKQLMQFQVLDFYWKCLKSGINYTKRVQGREPNDVKRQNPERYIKPYLWTYLNETKNLTWEKRLIKQTFNQLETIVPNRGIVQNNNTPIFARGMMGCPMFFEYKVPKEKFYRDKKGRLVEEKEEYRVNLSNEEIERISSPIIFKSVFSDDTTVSVYVLFDKDIITAAEQKQSKTFSFTCERMQKRQYVPIEGNVTIDIAPSSIDYLQMIQKYHHFIGTDKQMSDSIFKDTGIYGDARKFKMIPRNFQWKNILGKTGNNENLISFLQVKHS